MNVLITGGGTGGHLSIAKALGITCKSRGFDVYYVGSTSGQDRLWFENSDIFKKCYFLDSTGVVNKRGTARFYSLYLQLKAILSSIKIIKKNKIDAVISVGGFSAGGASFASVICRIPFFMHEQNSILGTLNKILSPFAQDKFCSFDLDGFTKTSYPINSDFFYYARDRNKLDTILFIGGSQGAYAINSFALELSSELLKRKINIIHQCGKLDFDRVYNGYKNLTFKDVDIGDNNVRFIHKNGSEVLLFSFDKNLIHHIKNADFCVSRSGASSLWELCANRLPSYFIPYPYATKNHQYYNALFLGDLCMVATENELNKKDFLSYVDNLDLCIASRNLANIISPNGADEIINAIIFKLEKNI